jgi:hypothetical protein
MATETPINAAKAPVKLEERTWRANIETPRGGAYSIQVYRQQTKLDEDGTVVGESKMLTTPVQRLATAIQNEQVTIPGGTVVTAAQVLAALPLFFDRWATEDANAEQPIND